MNRRSGLLLPIVCLVTFWTGDHAADGQEAEKTEYYRFYLIDACEKLDCYFTVERGVYRKDRFSPLTSLNVLPEEVGTVDELVEKLRRELKGVKVEVVKEDGKPPVIHLIEESLAESKDYALDRRVSLTFRGTLSELLTRLEQESGRVSEQRAGTFPVTPPSDSETKTQLKVKDGSVREVLTEAVLLEGYARFLWEAALEEQDGKPLVKIRFTGPKDLDNWQVETDIEGV